MKPLTATAIAFVAATTLPAVLMGVLFPLFGRRTVESILVTTSVFLCFTVLTAAVLGVPAYLLLKRFKWVTWWSATGCGALMGWLAVLVFGSHVDAAAERIYAALGAATGLLFWSIWRLGHRDAALAKVD